MFKILNSYEMQMFKCVTMAKCGNSIIIDDKFNKVSILSAIDFSIIKQKTLVEDNEDAFYYMYSAGLASNKIFVGYDSNKIEVWDSNNFNCISQL